MTDFDHELIAALAEGTLPADEAADLEARIGADPAASAELEAQRVALAAIAAAPAPQLDDLERMRLHRSVAAELDLVLPQPAASPRRRRWSVNWSALATAAAVLLGVALAAPLLSLLNTSGSSDATTTVAAEAADEAAREDLQSATLDAAAETLPAEDDLAAAGSPVQEAAPPATEAPADTTMLAAATTTADGEPTAGFAPLVDFGALDDELTQAQARLERFAGPPDDDVGEGTGESPPCVEEVRSSLLESGAEESTTVSLLGTGTFAGDPVYVLSVTEDDVVRQLTAVDADDCSTVAVAPIE